MAQFTLEEARRQLVQVKEITGRAVHEANGLAESANALDAESPERKRLANEFNTVVNGWATEIQKLGAEVKGLWLVDFDAGDGYWCWQHPEETLDFFHGYDEGFAGRRRIAPEELN